MNRKLLVAIIASFTVVNFGISNERAPNNELLRLLFSTFLGANDLKNAFDVAKKAVEAYPNDPYWWEWYGKVATWLGNTEDAIKASLKLVELRPLKENISKAFKFALSTQRYDVAVDLIKSNPWLANNLTGQELYFIFVNAGRIDEFLRFMDYLYKTEKKDEYLYLMALAQFNYGKYNEAKDYMKKLEDLRQLNLKEVILYSDILLAEKKQKKAYELLKKYINLIKDDDNDLYVLYLRRLSALAWINKDIQTSAEASDILDKMGKAQKEDYIRLYTYYSLKKDFRKAIEYAKKGFEKSKDEYLFTLWIEGLSALEEWKAVVEAYRNFDRNKLFSNSYLVALYARALYMLGRKNEGRQVLVQALKSNPSLGLISNSIYIASSFYDRDLIDYLIKNYSMKEDELPKEFAILYMTKQEGQKAQRLIDKIKVKDKEELLLYSYSLDLLGRSDEAKAIRYDLLRELLHTRHSPEGTEDLRITLMSGIGLLPSYFIQELLKIAKKKLEPQIWINIYLSHLFVNNFYEEVEYLKNIKKVKLEPWMELSLALRHNDKEMINSLLESMSDILPYRDVVESYRRLGRFERAIEQAQQSLEKNPEDPLVYEQLRQLVDSYVSQIRTGISQRNVDKTGYLVHNISMIYTLTDRWYVLLSREGGFLVYNKNPTLINLPSYFDYNSVAVRYNTNNGSYELGISLGKSIDNFIGWEFKVSKRLLNLDNITFSVSYNSPAKETLITSLALLKDKVSISASKSLSPRIGMLFTLEYSSFKSQDMKYIGDGLSAYFETFYKLRYAYPDYTLRFFSSFWSYNENRQKSEKLLRLYTYDNPRVLPETSFTLGLGLRFGTDSKEMLSRGISPFLDSELFYNTSSGFGYGLSFGLSGRVLGKDTLFMGLRWSSNYGNVRSTYWEPYLQYRLLLQSP